MIVFDTQVLKNLVLDIVDLTCKMDLGAVTVVLTGKE